ncbi:hypothetical protein Tco_0572705 [Tanacetum coccineum]
MRSLSAVGSTIHSMIKLPTNQGIVTMKTSREALWECRQLERVQGSWKEVQSGVHRKDTKFQLKGIKRPMAPEGRLALKEKVFHWLKEGLIRKVQHPEWITNAIPIKLANKTWKVQVDYSSLNKVYAKDMYPFTKEGEDLASLLGYPYKCFLQLPKEYNQIRMAEDDEEKTGFHTKEGVYCFTHMPKELKNSATTLQRMMKKVLADQRGWNVEIYLEEVVIKSKSELDLV